MEDRKTRERPPGTPVSERDGGQAAGRDGARKVAVEISGVTKRFGDFVAVDDLSLEVYEGEFFSMLGPSGCGKTTTLRMTYGKGEEPGRRTM